MRLRTLVSLTTLLIATLPLVAAQSQVPELIGFQGHLTDLGGNAVEAPEGMEIEVNLYHESVGGNPFWTDVFDAVPVEGGVFSLLLGSGNNAIPSAQLSGGVKYLGVSVNGSAELQPLMQLVSVPYAMRSNTADSAITAQSADSIGGLSASDLVTKTELAQLSPSGDLSNKVAALEAQVAQLQDLMNNPGCFDECTGAELGCTDDGMMAYTCGEANDGDPCNEKLYELCYGSQKCVSTTCECAPAYSNVCIGDDAYEQDSCGVAGKLIATCGEGLCNDGTCINWDRETPLQLPGMRGLFTIGGHLYAVGDNGAVVHYDGSHWTRMATGTTKNLHAIWGYATPGGTTILYAVGQQGKMIRYNGSTWSTVITGFYSDLNAIHGLSEDQLYAVGANGLVLERKAGNWSAVEWDEEASWTTTQFNGVWVYSASRAWVGGNNGTILFYDGEGWTQQSTPSGNTVFGIWGISDQNVWAGTSGQIWHFGGEETWSSQHEAGVNVFALWNTLAPVEVFAVGDSSRVFKSDLASWAQQGAVVDGLGGSANLRGIAGDDAPANGAWIIAEDGRVAYRDATAKWVFPAITREIRGFYAAPGSGDDILAVGSDCLALRLLDGEWLESGAPIDADECQDGVGSTDFLAIWGSGNTVIAAGENGMLKSWDSTNWLTIAGPNGNHNRDIWGTDANNLFVVQDGSSFVWNGVSWQNTGGGGGVSGIGTSMTDLHVVSGTNSGLFHGTVQSFDGSEWTSEQLTNYALYDIWGTSGNNIWVVGESGTVFHYNGSSWVDASIPDDILKNGQLNAVWTTSPFPVYVAADGGDTYIRTGNVWKHERTFPNTAHRIVYGVDGNNVLMGGQGTIFRRN